MKAEAYALSRGLDLDTELTYRDEGVSGFQGRNVETGKLGAFLEAAKAGLVPRGSYLLLESLDRMSRQVARKAFRVLEDICEEGITVVTLTDNREYTIDALEKDPTAFLMSILIFIRANEESAMKSMRVSASWDSRKKAVKEDPKGAVKLTSVSPAWLTLNEKTKRWEATPEAKAVIRRIYREAAAGKGLGGIAEGLNRDRVPVLKKAKHWHPSYVLKVLQNEAVVGTYVPHKIEYVKGKKVRVPDGEPVKNYYPRIIDDALYASVRALRANSKAPRRGRHAGQPMRNILATMATCSRCGGSMYRVSKGDGPKGGQYLVCQKAKVGAGCKYETIRYNYVEHALIANADRIVFEAPSGKDSALDRDVIAAESILNALDESIENLIRSIEHRSSPLLSDRLRAAEAERLQVRASLDNLYARVAAKSGPLVQRRLDDLHAALTAEPVSREAANVALRQLFRSAVVNVKEGTLDLAWAHASDETAPLSLIVTMSLEVVPKVTRKAPKKARKAKARPKGSR